MKALDDSLSGKLEKHGGPLKWSKNYMEMHILYDMWRMPAYLSPEYTRVCHMWFHMRQKPAAHLVMH